jgi:hypothetical protein
MSDKAIMKADDESLIRWVAMLLIEGKSESEIRRMLVENRLLESQAPPSVWRDLLSASVGEAEAMRGMVLNRAELGSTDWLRLDSYTRRKRVIDRMESVVDQATEQADSISKLNTVSFMLTGLNKAQESMDKFTGAQEAVPQVQVNIGYDPIDQFRGVIQAEARTVIDIPPSAVRVDEEE